MLTILKTLNCKHYQFRCAKVFFQTASNLPYYNHPGTFCSRHKRSLERLRCLKHPNSNFHTTWRLQVSPYFMLFACTSLECGSFLLGCYLRHWWFSKSEVQREKYKNWFKERKMVFFNSFGFFFLILLVYYITHLEPDPILNRYRFIIFDKTEQTLIGNIIFLTLLSRYEKSLIPINDPLYRRLSKIVEKLTINNRDAFKETEWTISIVDAPLPNAMVLPGGHIFVFSGIFDVSENDDQLAFILAHEMSHVLLLHTTELVSYMVLKEITHAIPTILLWACFSKWKAIMLQVGVGILYKLTVLYPYKRRLELEADEVGFKLAAKACIDLREVLVFWNIMSTLTDLTEENQYKFYWFSTHPRHKDRGKKLAGQLPNALKLRRQRDCPELPAVDPQKKFDERSTKELEEHFREKGLL